MSLGVFALGDEPLGGFGDDELPAIDLTVSDISFGLYVAMGQLTQIHNLAVDDLTFSLFMAELDLSSEPPVSGPGTLTIGITGPSISIGIPP